MIRKKETVSQRIEQKYEYYAFISYKHEDTAVAKWLRRKLQAYLLPTKLRKQQQARVKRLTPVFLDKTDLLPGYLREQITEFTKICKYLIIICSEHTHNAPKYIDDEVKSFLEAGHEPSQIILFIVGNSKHPEIDCFPPTIQKICETKELLGVNIHDAGKRIAFLKTVAYMHDVDMTKLIDLDRIRRRRQQIIVSVSALVLLLSAAIAYNMITTARQDRRDASAALYSQYAQYYEDDTKLSMAYLLAAVREQPRDTVYESAKAMTLLYHNAWPYISEEGAGRIIDSTLVTHKGTLSAPDCARLTVAASISLSSIEAVSVESDRLLLREWSSLTDNKLRVVDTSGKEIRCFEGQTKYLRTAADQKSWILQAEKYYIIYNIKNDTVYTLDYPNSERLEPLLVASSIDCAKNSSLVVYANRERLYIYVLENNAYSLKHSVELDQLIDDALITDYPSVTIEKHGYMLALQNHEQRFFMYDISDPTALSFMFSVKQDQQIITDIQFDRSCKRVLISYGYINESTVSISHTGRFVLYQYDGTQLFQYVSSNNDGVRSASFAYHDQYILASFYGGDVRLFDIAGQTEIIVPVTLTNTAVSAILTNDGESLVVEDTAGHVVHYRFYRSSNEKSIVLDDGTFPVLFSVADGDDTVYITANEIVRVASEGTIMERIRRTEAAYQATLISLQEHLPWHQDAMKLLSLTDGHRTKSLSNGYSVHVGVTRISLYDRNNEMVFTDRINALSDVVFSNDGRDIFVCSSSGSPAISHLKLDESNMSYTIADTASFLRFYPQYLWLDEAHHQLAIASTNGRLIVLDTDAFSHVISMLRDADLCPVGQVAFDDSGRFLACAAQKMEDESTTLAGATQGMIELWDQAKSMLVFSDKRDGVKAGMVAFRDATLIYSLGSEVIEYELVFKPFTKDQLDILQVLAGYEMNEHGYMGFTGTQSAVSELQTRLEGALSPSNSMD